MMRSTYLRTRALPEQYLEYEVIRLVRCILLGLSTNLVQFSFDTSTRTVPYPLCSNRVYADDGRRESCNTSGSLTKKLSAESPYRAHCQAGENRRNYSNKSKRLCPSQECRVRHRIALNHSKHLAFEATIFILYVVVETTVKYRLCWRVLTH